MCSLHSKTVNLIIYLRQIEAKKERDKMVLVRISIHMKKENEYH